MSYTGEVVNDACSLVSRKMYDSDQQSQQSQQTQTRRRSDPVIVPAPDPPSTNDHQGWDRFLAAYRSGKWDLDRDVNDTESEDDLSTSDLAIVYDINGMKMNNQGKSIRWLLRLVLTFSPFFFFSSCHKDYFQRYHHLAPPSLPPQKRRKRHEALLRHGIVYPHVRQHLQRYVELAKRIFECDLVTLSFASADEKHIIFLAADGPPLSHVPNCASICSHALLLEGESDIFVVPDMSRDWRFDRLFGEDGIHQEMTYKFHASAPIFLSCAETPCCKISVSPVHAGRFSIFSAKPRPNFNHSDARTLLDFARMTQEAMENDIMEKFVNSTRSLQLQSMNVIASLNESFEARIRSEVTSQATRSKLYGLTDLFPLLSKKVITKDSNQNSLDAKPIYNSLLEDVDAMQKMLDMVRSSLSAKTACLIDGSKTSIAPIIPFHSKEDLENQCFETPEPNNFSMNGQDLISTVTFSGDADLLPDSKSPRSIYLLRKWFEMVRLNPARHRSQILQRSEFCQSAPIREANLQQRSEVQKRKCPYGVHDLNQSKSSRRPCCCVKYTAETAKMIEPILPDGVSTCLIIPIVAENAAKLKRAPLALMCILWDHSTSVSTSEMDFCSTLAVHLAGLVCQEQASIINHGQLSMIRMMQHELRTPLNGIVGISEALRQDEDEIQDIQGTENQISNSSLAPNASPNEKLSKDRVSQAAEILAPQLESIHVSSIMLTNILDDILSLDSMFEGANETGRRRSKSDNRNLEHYMNFSKLLEDACREELGYFELEAMRTFRALSTIATGTPFEEKGRPDYGRRRSSLATIATVIDSMKLNEEGKDADSQNTNDQCDKPKNERNSNDAKLEALHSSVIGRESISLTLPPSMLINIENSLSERPIGDHNKLIKILRKLVSNAIKFTPQEGVVEVDARHVATEHVHRHMNSILMQQEDEKESCKGRKSLSSMAIQDMEIFQKFSSDTQWIQFHIKDTGIGMTDAFLQESYLEPFMKANTFSQGMGLGSTVAFALTKTLNGVFTIQSCFDEGTEINVFLPFSHKEDHKYLPTSELNSVSNQAKQPSAFKYARIIGFQEEVGSQKIRIKIEHILKSYGINILQERNSTNKEGLSNESYSLRDDEIIYIFHENAFSAPVSSLPYTSDQTGIRSVIFQRNSLKSRSDTKRSSFVRNGSSVNLSPPFGPSTWSRFERLLQPMLTSKVNDESSMTHDINHQECSRDTQFPLPLTRDQLDFSTTKSLLNSINPSNNQIEEPPQQQITQKFTSALQGSSNMNLNNTTIKAEISQDTESQPTTNLTTPTNPFKVLAVEDNPINMRLLTTVLRKLSISFVEARDGVEAVKQFKAFEPTLVLLDISLPLMDGFDACIAMRKHTLPFRAKIIAITAFSTPEDKERGLTVCEMDDWQTKPVSIKMLNALLSQNRIEHENKVKGSMELSK